MKSANHFPPVLIFVPFWPVLEANSNCKVKGGQQVHANLWVSWVKFRTAVHSSTKAKRYQSSGESMSGNQKYLYSLTIEVSNEQRSPRSRFWSGPLIWSTLVFFFSFFKLKSEFGPLLNNTGRLHKGRVEVQKVCQWRTQARARTEAWLQGREETFCIG